MRSQDTIFAQSTAPGRSGVAIIRVSGPEAFACVRGIAGEVPAPRQAQLRSLKDPATGELIDRGLVLAFSGPNSFTGEDVVEFHVHGGRAVTAGLLEALSHRSGLRPAEPGEFTRRAFLAGKMDLSETEALADLLDAETAAQRRQALNGLSHGIGQKAEQWRERLIHAQALAEAEIDFPDEGDVPSGLIDQARDLVQALRSEVAGVLAAPGGERLREGAIVVIAGPPNAGKSSFLNRVAQREVAIVTPHAGTTRDMIEVAVDLNGFPVTLIDTAGFRETSDEIEIEALRRAEARLAGADLVLGFQEAGGVEVPFPVAGAVPVWRVWNKSDLHAGSVPDGWSISAKTGEGVGELLVDLGRWLADYMHAAEAAPITRLRHREALGDALASLNLAVDAPAAELFAEHLRLSAHALARISGRVDVEDVLDAVFGAFCIGK